MSQKLQEPVIIVLSDVHLGASKSKSLLLYEFLMQIRKKQYGKDVKAIVVIGDFLDVCMENCSDIEDEFSNIFHEIDQFNRSGIPVVFSLGNHEIKVTSNNETKFLERKLEFIEEFKQPPFSQTNIGQYINIRRDDSKIKIDVYDSLKSFDRNDKLVNSIPINVNFTNNNNFSCLLSHGHQLESRITLFFVGGLVWGRLIKSKDRIYKKFMDFLWNTLISGDVSISNLNKRDIKYLIKKENLSWLEARKYRRNLKNIREWELRKIKKRNEKYTKKAKKLLSKKKRFKRLTHFAFGHSHTNLEKQLKVKKRKKATFGLCNPGTWQKIERPTYLEIDLNTLKIHKKDLDITQSLKSLGIFNEFQDSSIRKLRRKLIEALPDKKREIILYSSNEIINEAYRDKIITEVQKTMLEGLIKLKKDYLSDPKSKKSEIHTFITDEFDETDDQFQI